MQLSAKKSRWCPILKSCSAKTRTLPPAPSVACADGGASRAQAQDTYNSTLYQWQGLHDIQCACGGMHFAICEGRPPAVLHGNLVLVAVCESSRLVILLQTAAEPLSKGPIKHFLSWPSTSCARKSPLRVFQAGRLIRSKSSQVRTATRVNSTIRTGSL